MLKKVTYFLFVAFVFVALIFAYLYYSLFLKKINFPDEKTYVYVRTNSNFEDVLQYLDEHKIVSNTIFFREFAKLRNLHNNIHPGRYTIPKGMSKNELILLLRSGQSDEITITFYNLKNLKELTEHLSKYIEAKESDLYDLLTSPQTHQKLGFNKNNFISLFIPNSYRFYWNTTAEDFLNRMQQEYKNFWNEERKNKARKMGLTQAQISTLASIVQAEQAEREEEWPVIAGLYFNRLQHGIKLQSDPTVIFAVGDFSIRRVYHKHLQYNSPYNTYYYQGLPPGPIRISSIKAIDAVLNHQKHNYIYMCAKPKSGGLHVFTASYDEHLKNARNFQNHLDNLNIKE
jgi:UPF0755 protein